MGWQVKSWCCLLRRISFLLDARLRGHRAFKVCAFELVFLLLFTYLPLAATE
jgi:hypothetical protein